MIETSPTQSAVRRKADRAGYRVVKSRERKHVPHSQDHGEFMLVETWRNIPVLGWGYDATLQDIADFLSDEEVAA